MKQSTLEERLDGWSGGIDGRWHGESDLDEEGEVGESDISAIAS